MSLFLFVCVLSPALNSETVWSGDFWWIGDFLANDDNDDDDDDNNNSKDNHEGDRKRDHKDYHKSKKIQKSIINVFGISDIICALVQWFQIWRIFPHPSNFFGKI